MAMKSLKLKLLKFQLKKDLMVLNQSTQAVKLFLQVEMNYNPFLLKTLQYLLRH